MPLRLPLIASATVLIATLGAETAVAAEVAVTTVDGLLHRGVADTRTDADNLWLRRDEANLSLAFSVPWSAVVAALVDGERVAPELLASRLTGEVSGRSSLSVLVGPIERMPAAPVAGHAPTLNHGDQVARLEVAARVGQFDADAQADGIEVGIAPATRLGGPASVRGELTIKLLGVRQVSRHRHAFREVGRWSQPVSPSDFDAATGAACYRLAFQGVEPAADWRLGSDAVVHASLGVYGQGRFEASAPVSLRQFDPLRDQLQQATGRRHFPVERATGTPPLGWRYGSAIWSDP
ncbi:MAG: hypothetical protein AAGB00_10105 [Planctomycetota bacterium]